MFDKKVLAKMKCNIKNSLNTTTNQSNSYRLKLIASLSHLLQHLYIGAAPLLFPLIMKELNFTYFYIGLTISVRTFFAGFCQLFYSFLEKIMSRKMILNLSNLLSIISSIGIGLSKVFPVFLFFNALWGISTSPIHPLGRSLIWSSSPKSKNGFDIGVFYSYAYLGNIIGAVIVILFIARIGWEGIFFLIALLTFPVFIYGCFVRGEVPTEDKRKREIISEFKEAFKDREVLLISLVGLLFFGGTNVFIRHLIPLFLTNQIRLPVQDVTFIFLLISAIGIFSPPFFGWILSKFNKKVVMTSIAFSLAILFYLIADQKYLTYNLLLILFFQALLGWPLLALLQSFLHSVLGPNRRDIGGDILLTISISSFIIWGIVFGYLIDISGNFTSTFYFISALCIISIPLILSVNTRKLESKDSFSTWRE